MDAYLSTSETAIEQLGGILFGLISIVYAIMSLTNKESKELTAYELDLQTRSHLLCARWSVVRSCDVWWALVGPDGRQLPALIYWFENEAGCAEPMPQSTLGIS